MTRGQGGGRGRGRGRGRAPGRGRGTPKPKTPAKPNRRSGLASTSGSDRDSSPSGTDGGSSRDTSTSRGSSPNVDPTVFDMAMDTHEKAKSVVATDSQPGSIAGPVTWQDEAAALPNPGAPSSQDKASLDGPPFQVPEGYKAVSVHRADGTVDWKMFEITRPVGTAVPSTAAVSTTSVTQQMAPPAVQGTSQQGAPQSDVAATSEAERVAAIARNIQIPEDSDIATHSQSETDEYDPEQAWGDVVVEDEDEEMENDPGTDDSSSDGTTWTPVVKGKGPFPLDGPLLKYVIRDNMGQKLWQCEACMTTVQSKDAFVTHVRKCQLWQVSICPFKGCGFWNPHNKPLRKHFEECHALYKAQHPDQMAASIHPKAANLRRLNFRFFDEGKKISVKGCSLLPPLCPGTREGEANAILNALVDRLPVPPVDRWINDPHIQKAVTALVLPVGTVTDETQTAPKPSAGRGSKRSLTSDDTRVDSVEKKPRQGAEKADLPKGLQVPPSRTIGPAYARSAMHYLLSLRQGKSDACPTAHSIYNSLKSGWETKVEFRLWEAKAMESLDQWELEVMPPPKAPKVVVQDAPGATTRQSRSQTKVSTPTSTGKSPPPGLGPGKGARPKMGTSKTYSSAAATPPDKGTYASVDVRKYGMSRDRSESTGRGSGRGARDPSRSQVIDPIAERYGTLLNAPKERIIESRLRAYVNFRASALTCSEDVKRKQIGTYLNAKTRSRSVLAFYNLLGELLKMDARRDPVLKDRFRMDGDVTIQKWLDCPPVPGYYPALGSNETPESLRDESKSMDHRSPLDKLYDEQAAQYPVGRLPGPGPGTSKKTGSKPVVTKQPPPVVARAPTVVVQPPKAAPQPSPLMEVVEEDGSDAIELGTPQDAPVVDATAGSGVRRSLTDAMSRAAAETSRDPFAGANLTPAQTKELADLRARADPKDPSQRLWSHPEAPRFESWTACGRMNLPTCFLPGPVGQGGKDRFVKTVIPVGTVLDTHFETSISLRDGSRLPRHVSMVAMQPCILYGRLETYVETEQDIAQLDAWAEGVRQRGRIRVGATPDFLPEELGVDPVVLGRCQAVTDRLYEMDDRQYLTQIGAQALHVQQRRSQRAFRNVPAAATTLQMPQQLSVPSPEVPIVHRMTEPPVLPPATSQDVGAGPEPTPNPNPGLAQGVPPTAAVAPPGSPQPPKMVLPVLNLGDGLSASDEAYDTPESSPTRKAGAIRHPVSPHLMSQAV